MRADFRIGCEIIKGFYCRFWIFESLFILSIEDNISIFDVILFLWLGIVYSVQFNIKEFEVIKYSTVNYLSFVQLTLIFGVNCNVVWVLFYNLSQLVWCVGLWSWIWQLMIKFRELFSKIFLQFLLFCLVLNH